MSNHPLCLDVQFHDNFLATGVTFGIAFGVLDVQSA